MKHETRVDSRTVQTKRIIRETLREMILEMDYQQITISELTKRAQLHRKTFYLHYSSIEALFDELCADIAEEVNAAVDKELSEREDIRIIDVVQGLAAVLEQDTLLHRRLYCRPSYEFVYSKIQHIATDHLYHALLGRVEIDPDLLEGIVIFVSYGCNAVWRSYYSQGHPNAPENTMPSLLLMANNARDYLEAERF